MAVSNSKGDRRERELARLFDDQDPKFAVTREPASGSATERKLPDLHVGRTVEKETQSEYAAVRYTKTITDDNYAIEAKSSSGTPIYIEAHEVEGLTWYAEQFDADPLIGVKFDVEYGDPDYGADSSGWYFFPPESLYRTDGGNYRVKKETALSEGIPFEELVEVNDGE